MATFLNITFMLLLMVTNTHHLLLQAAQNSYILFPVGEPPMMTDAAQWALGAFADAFMIGVQMADRILETFGGFEYESCCWAMRRARARS